MESKFKNIVNKILNVSLLVIIISVSAYAWMITEPSRGEILNYKRKLVITSNDLDIKSFVYDEETQEYYEDNSSPMNVGLTEPGKIQKYKFEITNNKDIVARTNIIFSNITGDIEDLGNVIFFGATNPSIFETAMASMLEENTNKSQYIKFMEDLKIPANSTISVYWYVYIDQYASNEIVDKDVEIEKIMFVKA